MSIIYRLILLYALLTATFIGLQVYSLHLHHDETDSLRENFRLEKIRQTDQVFRLQSRSFRYYVYDYSYWDELVAYVHNPDPEWIRANRHFRLYRL